MPGKPYRRPRGAKTSRLFVKNGRPGGLPFLFPLTFCGRFLLFADYAVTVVIPKIISTVRVSRVLTRFADLSPASSPSK